MNIYPRNKKSLAEIRKFIVIFYIVGFIGFVIPYTRPLFVTITPFALLLSVYLLAIYHPKAKRSDMFLFLFIFLAGYSVELAGVKTGMIFGIYSYGSALGFKLFETPLLIGVNWLFLSYTATAIASSLQLRSLWHIVFAPSLMLMYDLVLERVAPKLNMWTWQNSEVPVQNYIAWYFIALVFVLLLKTFKAETKNPLASLLFVCQFVFFTLLSFLL